MQWQTVEGGLQNSVSGVYFPRCGWENLFKKRVVWITDGKATSVGSTISTPRLRPLVLLFCSVSSSAAHRAAIPRRGEFLGTGNWRESF